MYRLPQSDDTSVFDEQKFFYKKEGTQYKTTKHLRTIKYLSALQTFKSYYMNRFLKQYFVCSLSVYACRGIQ